MFFNRGAANAFSAIVAEKAVNAELRSQVARLTAHCDWLMAHVNELKLERAQLYERIGLYVPVPTIQHGGQPPVPEQGAAIPHGRVLDMGDLMQKAREIRTEDEHARKTREDGNMPMSEGSEMDIFSDVGDEMASKLKIERDAETGEVISR